MGPVNWGECIVSNRSLESLLFVIIIIIIVVIITFIINIIITIIIIVHYSLIVVRFSITRLLQLFQWWY